MTRCRPPKPPSRREGRFRVRPFSSEYAPGIDPNDPKVFKNFLHQLDDEHFLEVQRRSASRDK